MDTGTKIFLSILIVYWFICFVYMLRWHADQGNLSVGTVILAMIIGPVIALVIKSENSWRDGDSLEYHGRRTREKLEANIRALEEIRRRYDNVPIIDNTPKTKKLEEFKFFQK